MQAVFVFGSNTAGRHGKGAALHAREQWGAEDGVGEGETGRAYALPTMDEDLKPLALDRIDAAIARLVDHAKGNPGKLYLLTPVGCGYAGHDAKEVARRVTAKTPPANIALTLSWLDHLMPSGDGS